jgi:CarD family transcriptional regulator
MGHAQNNPHGFELEQVALTNLLIRAKNGNEQIQAHGGVNRDMNFDGQKSRSDYSEQIHAAPDNSADQTTGSQRSERRFGFKATDFVVYPAHGVGQIIAIEEQTVAEASLEFFVIYFAKSKMTLRAPTRKATNVGMRKLSDPAAILRVRRTLTQAPYKARGNWSRLAQEYESKINSGDIIAIAEVIRDLHRPGVNSGQSYSERQLYMSALNRLSEEVALVNSITEEEAVKELEGLMIAGAG